MIRMGSPLIVVDDFTCSRDHTCLIVTHWTVLPSFCQNREPRTDSLSSSSSLVIFCVAVRHHHDVIAGHKIIKKAGQRPLRAREASTTAVPFVWRRTTLADNPTHIFLSSHTQFLYCSIYISEALFAESGFSMDPFSGVLFFRNRRFSMDPFSGVLFFECGFFHGSVFWSSLFPGFLIF